MGDQGVIALSARLREAIVAAATLPADAAALVARFTALDAAARAVASAQRPPASVDGRTRRRVIEDVRAARLALARCLGTRATVRELAAIVGGGGAYGSDGEMAIGSAVPGAVRHV